MRAEGVALVTGASRGIGRAVAVELARRGFDVIAGMRDPRAGAGLPERGGDRGGRISVVELDVTRPDSIRIPDALRVLVNNAGIEGPYLPVEHAPVELWREIFETNVFGLLETTRRALPALRKARRGVVCNVTSCSLLVPMPLFAAYRASKAAVAALGESLRAEVARFGIRVVEIQPGAIATDMLRESDRVPEAERFAEYRDLARRVHASRAGVGDQVTTPEQAAGSIVDAILDDSGPLRHACDPMGARLLEAWRHQTDEEMMAGMLAFFGAEPA